MVKINNTAFTSKQQRYLSIIFLHLLLLLSPIIAAQIKVPKVTKELLTQRKFEIDPTAAAIILYKAAQTDFEWDNKNSFKTITLHKQQIKILNKSAFNLANISIPFLASNNYEKVFKVTAKVYNWTNNKIEITTLSKKDIYTIEKNFACSEIKFALPNIRVGSIFEISYTLEKESYSNINTWQFQNELPTILSQYIVNIPEYFVFNTKITAPAHLKLVKEKFYNSFRTAGKGSRFITTQNNYTITNIPATNQEPFQTNNIDNRYKIELSLKELTFYNDDIFLNTDWNFIAKWANEHALIGQQSNKKIILDSIAIVLKNCPTQYDSIAAIYNWLHKKSTWNQIYDIYCFDLKSVADNFSGNSAELNLLLYQQLKLYKLPANLLLASTKDNGTVNDSFPSTNQFNTILIYSKTKKSELPFILDLAGENQMIDHQPSSNLLNTKALFILDKDTANIINLIEHNISRSYNSGIDIFIEPDGNMHTTGVANFTGLDALKFHNFNGILTGAQLFNHTKKDLKINKYKIVPIQDIYPNTEIRFSYNDSSFQKQQYITLQHNFIYNWSHNPFVADIRLSDIDFLSKANHKLFINYNIPSSFEALEVPKSMKILTENNELFFERSVERQDNNIKIQFSFNINTAIVNRNDYYIVQQFFNTMIQKLNQPIILERIKE